MDISSFEDRARQGLTQDVVEDAAQKQNLTITDARHEHNSPIK